MAARFPPGNTHRRLITTRPTRIRHHRRIRHRIMPPTRITHPELIHPPSLRHAGHAKATLGSRKDNDVRLADFGHRIPLPPVTPQNGPVEWHAIHPGPASRDRRQRAPASTSRKRRDTHRATGGRRTERRWRPSETCCTQPRWPGITAEPYPTRGLPLPAYAGAHSAQPGPPGRDPQGAATRPGKASDAMQGGLQPARAAPDLTIRGQKRAHSCAKHARSVRTARKPATQANWRRLLPFRHASGCVRVLIHTFV